MSFSKLHAAVFLFLTLCLFHVSAALLIPFSHASPLLMESDSNCGRLSSSRQTIKVCFLSVPALMRAATDPGSLASLHPLASGARQPPQEEQVPDQRRVLNQTQRAPAGSNCQISVSSWSFDMWDATSRPDARPRQMSICQILVI